MRPSMRTSLLSLLLAACALAPVGTPAAQAAPAARDHGRDQALPEAVRRVERETNGQVLRAEQMRSGGQRVPRLKVLTPDGRVRVMRADGDEVAALRPPPRTGERAIPPRQPARADARDRPLQPTTDPRDDGARRQD